MQWNFSQFVFDHIDVQAVGIWDINTLKLFKLKSWFRQNTPWTVLKLFVWGKLSKYDNKTVKFDRQHFVIVVGYFVLQLFLGHLYAWKLEVVVGCLEMKSYSI